MRSPIRLPAASSPPRRLRRLCVLGPWALLAGTAWAAPAAPGAAVAWPERIALLGGGELRAADLRQRLVVVVFWSTTCAFCRRHNQHVEKLHRLAAGQGLKVLGVARESDAALVRRYAQQQGYSFAITLDHAPLAAVLASRNILPLTTTVNRQGLLHEVIPGEMFEDDVLGLIKLARTEKPA